MKDFQRWFVLLTVIGQVSGGCSKRPRQCSLPPWDPDGISPDTQNSTGYTTTVTINADRDETGPNTTVLNQSLSSGSHLDDLIDSLGEELNQLNNDHLQNAISNGVPATRISVSPLGTSRSTTGLMRVSALKEFDEQLKSRAKIREYLLELLPINTMASQAKSLAQLTQATNELTHVALTVASDRCYRLALALHSVARQISAEDVRTTATQLLQCSANVLTAVNGPRQQRMIALDSDRDTNQVTKQMNELMSLVTKALIVHLPIGQRFIMNTSAMFMSLEAISSESLLNREIQSVGKARVRIPSRIETKLDGHPRPFLRSTLEPLAPSGQWNTNLSRLISLTLLDRGGNEVPLTSNIDHPFELVIPRDPSMSMPPMSLQKVVDSPYQDPWFNLHHVDITGVSLHLDFHSLKINRSYLLIYRFDRSPVLTSSVQDIDGWTIFSAANEDKISTFFLDNEQTLNHRSVIFGVRELHPSETTDGTLPVPRERLLFTSDYELRLYSSACLYLDEHEHWQSDGLKVGPSSNHRETQCFSTHLTKFASGFVVLPAPVNWNYVFAHADFMKNKTIYLTVIGVTIIYIALAIYARYFDKLDLQKLGVTPMLDNHQADQYFYQLLVFTGLRKGAGTKSKVQFLLAGDEDETRVRTLADPHRSILQRGGIDSFLIAVPKSLGSLNYLRIWHDNSGEGAASSWFMKYCIVRDLQTMRKDHFICQRWLAVEKDDGKIERLLPVASEVDKRDFSYVFSKKTHHKLSDEHLWYSIFSRPASTRFTRVQRCTCCFVLLFLSMFLNIMYYDLNKETSNSTSASLTFGTFRISPQQVVIGIIVEIVALVPSLLLVQVFRRVRPRRKPISPLEQSLSKLRPTPLGEPIKATQGRRPWTLPWWCLYLNYVICLSLVGVSIVFILARGIEFGDVKSQQWLTSIVSGFFSSVLLSQPMKVLCMAVAFSLFCAKPNDDREANEHFTDSDDFGLNQDEEYLHPSEKHSIFTYRTPVRTHRLTDAEVAFARRERLREIHMWSIIQEAMFYAVFLGLLCFLTYANRSSHAYEQVHHLRKYLINSRDTDLDLTKVVTVDDYWSWLQKSFAPNLRAQEWYNGDPPRYLSGFLKDKTQRLIGWPVMRQIRVRSDDCPNQKIQSMCEDDYHRSNEEDRLFLPSWNRTTTSTSNSSVDQAFRYQSSDELDSYYYVADHASYPGGGYVYAFRGRLVDLQTNLSELHRLQWIDSRTRAVIIQLNLYNPNVQLFTSVFIIMEFLAIGSLFPLVSVEPISFSTLTSMPQLISFILYMCLIVYSMLDEFRIYSRLKRAYLYRLWSYIEVGIIACSWAAVVIYAWRYREAKRLGSLFEQTRGYVYINLQLATYVNNALDFLLAYCCFFGTIKFLRLCQYNQRLSLFSKTLRNAARELVSFSMMFSVVFVAFLCLFYFLFVSKINACKSFLQTAQMLFEMTLLKFDATDLTGAATFLGPFCFSLFIVLVVFVCLSMFLSIINDSFRRARLTIHLDQEEIFSLMWKKFVRWTGLKKSTPSEIYERQDSRMRDEYHDPVERFPEKIDQLLAVLNRLHAGQIAEKNRMEEKKAV